MQVAPSVEYMHEGHLGEVTFRGGAVTSPIPPPISPLPPGPPEPNLGLLLAKQKEQLDVEPPPPPTKDSMELIGGEHHQGSTLAYSSKTSGHELIGGILGPEPAPIMKDEKGIEAPECKFRRGNPPHMT